MRFFDVKVDKSLDLILDGDLDAYHRWRLPYVVRCPKCGASPEGDNSGAEYPCVDLSGLPAADQALLTLGGRPVSLEEFVRLREVVRPLAPPDAVLKTDAQFGPLQGRARGSFALFHMQTPSSLVVQPGLIDDVPGIKLCPVTEVVGKVNFLDVQLQHHGHKHDSCRLPEGPPCTVCGIRPVSPAPRGWKFVVDAQSLSGPDVPELFRLREPPSVILASERFVERVHRLRRPEPLGITFEEMPLQ